jgi:DNA helicase MCM8
LESLIRLGQARARLELREEVTEQDAHDVVQLLQESMLDVFADAVGEVIDCSRRGGQSMSKQVMTTVLKLELCCSLMIVGRSRRSSRS